MAAMALWDQTGGTAYAKYSTVVYNAQPWVCQVAGGGNSADAPNGAGTGDGYTWILVSTVGWDSNNANVTPSPAPAGGVLAAGFATDAEPASTLINWLFWTASAWFAFVSWLAGLFGYANTWTATQTFTASVSVTGAAGTIGIAATGGTGNAAGVQAIGTGTQPGVTAKGAITGTGPGVYATGGGGSGGSDGVIGNGGTTDGNGVVGIAAGGGSGVVGSSTSGPGVKATGNATRGPLALGTLGAAPTAGDALAGDMYVGGGHLYVCLSNGAWTEVV